MCNFYDAGYQAKRLGYLAGARLNLPKDWQPTHKVFPGGTSPIIRVNSEGQVVAEASQFKLIPDFAKTKNIRYSTMNARDDRLLKKGRNMWRPYFERQRCLVPAAAFYEHHTLSGKELIKGHDKPTNKVPFRIGLKSTDLFCFAGLWNKWTDPSTGEVLLSHAIITTDPNETVRKIHNSKPRMALILPESAYERWIGPVDKGEDLFEEGLFQAWPDEDMEYFQISKQFDYRPDDNLLQKPVEQSIGF